MIIIPPMVDFIQQSGVIPWRGKKKNLAVLLITSRHTGKWIIPKGYVEPYMSSIESAANEAEEEAGVEGVINPIPIGEWEREKAGYKYLVTIYPMRVTVERQYWLEKFERERIWVNIEEAVKAVYKPLAKIIKQLPTYLKKQELI